MRERGLKRDELLAQRKVFFNLIRMFFFLNISSCPLDVTANMDGISPLYVASLNGHLAVVEALLAQEAEPNQGDRLTQLGRRWAMFFLP